MNRSYIERFDIYRRHPNLRIIVPSQAVRLKSRFHIQFTPTCPSWLNPVERFYQLC